MPVDLGGNGVDERHLSFYLRSQRLVTIRDQILEDGKLGFELRTIFRVCCFSVADHPPRCAPRISSKLPHVLDAT